VGSFGNSGIGPLADARGFHEKAGLCQQQISKILDVFGNSFSGSEQEFDSLAENTVFSGKDLG
jgi:hypothetical protein